MKDNIFYNFLFYIAIIGLAFLLAPLLTYLFLIIGALLAGVGFIIDIILSIVLWWAGYEGNVGETIMNWVDVMSPIAAWLIFTVFVTIIFAKSMLNSWSAFEKEKNGYSHSRSITYADVAGDFYTSIKDIVDNYKMGKMGKDAANLYIKVRFKRWLRKKYNVTNEKDAEACWENKKWIIETKIKESSPEPAYPPGISPEGEMVLSLRTDYKKGKKTMEEANKYIRVAINIWAENNHCKERADEMYEKYKVDERLLNDDKK